MKLVLYSKINNTWLCHKNSGELPTILLSNESPNLFLSIAELLAPLLNVSIESFNHLFNPEFQSTLVHISAFTFTVNDTAYLPFRPLQSYSQFSPEIDPFLLETRLNLSLSHTYSVFKEISLHKSPDFLIFHMMDYNPWSGVTQALYGGFFIKETEQWNHYFIPKNQFPDDQALASAKGIVITGSRYCSFDESLSWIERLMQLIKDFVNKGKIVGICFGHQTVAKALGGVTARNPSVNYIYRPERIVSKSGREFFIMESHGDCVVEIPDGAEVTFSSDSCQVEMIEIADKVLTLQGHPEYFGEFLKHFHAKVRLMNKFMDENQYEELINSDLSRLSTREIIEGLNVFLRTGVNNLLS